VDEKSRFFFTPAEQIEYDAKAVEKTLKKDDNAGVKALIGVKESLSSVTDWSAATLHDVVNKFVETSGNQLGKVAQPIRVAISGNTVSPPIFESLALLGKAETLKRIDRCLSVAG